jgi:hypothetical protein
MIEDDMDYSKSSLFPFLGSPKIHTLVDAAQSSAALIPSRQADHILANAWPITQKSPRFTAKALKIQ